MYTCDNGHLENTKLLLEHGADANVKQNDGLAALTIASGGGLVEITRLLLSYGADANAKEDHGITALMVCSQKGHTEIPKLLLSHGAEVNSMRNNGNDSLMIAAVNGNLENIEILLEHGADVNARNYGGITAVSMAVAMANLFGNPTIAILLLEHGAMPETLSAAMRPIITAINYRIQEMNQIRESIKNEMLLIFPNHTPLVAKIISQFTNGLENLKKIAAEYIREN